MAKRRLKGSCPRRHRSPIGYQRLTADGAPVLVHAAGLPIGRVPGSHGPTNRLLVLSCSQRKNPSRQLLRAVDRYDGPSFRVLRKYLRTTGDASLGVCVLSAKYGIVTGDAPIPYYDLIMTPQRAGILRGSSASRLLKLVRNGRRSELFLCMSRTYLRAIPSVDSFGVPVRVAAAGQGKKLASLKAWLQE